MYALITFKESMRSICCAVTIACSIIAVTGCSADKGNTTIQPILAPVRSSSTLPVDAIPELIHLQAGFFIKGSDPAEREYGYKLDEAAYGHNRTRTGKWYDTEPDKLRVATEGYSIAKTPVTNRQYTFFIEDSGHRVPSVDEVTWSGYQLVHPYSSTHPYKWKNNLPPKGMEQHPVVLVSYDDAIAYTEWLSRRTGQTWGIPSSDQWERAARGDVGAIFPWGDNFDPTRLNSHDSGPFNTQPVGLYPNGASPHGMLDAAGQVFEWIATEPEQRSAWVKGGSWDDKGCGVCRPAARHARPKSIKHILVGFRVVRKE